MIGFVGGGRMASAIIRGLLRKGMDSRMIAVADPARSARDSFADMLPAGNIHEKNESLLSSGCGRILIAVKPQEIESVIRAFHGRALELVISIAAGVPLQRIESAIEGGVPVVRAMPNSPSLIGRGICALAAGRHAGERHMTAAEEIMASVGEVVRVEEKLIDAVTAISGSGPAYFFLFMRELRESALELGLPLEIATKLVLATAAGAALLAESSDSTFDELIAAVASKGGTTERALRVFKEGEFGKLVLCACAAAKKRAEELAG